MKIEDIPVFCAVKDVDWREVGAEHELGAGVLFHWNGGRYGGDTGECTHATLEALGRVTPGELERFIVDGRDVHHMTRIVGYYSRTENWNKSKLGELKARQAGNYQAGGAC